MEYQLASFTLNSSGFVSNLETGHSFAVNELGVQVLIRLKELASIDCIISELREVYDVSKEKLSKDLNTFIQELMSIGIVKILKSA